jgi:CheY-like chemotaxis protein
VPAQVLVVDDDPLTCELICEILRSTGMEANSVTDSAEAAKRLRHEKYHAVFLDMRMPPPDGVELARQVRASRVNASTVIVMITGEEDRTLMQRAFEAGVEVFLFKPVERNKLLRLIRVAEGPIQRERRRFTRVRLRCRVSMESANDRLEGTTLDLSLGGVLVQSHYAFPPGTHVRVSLELEAGAAPLRSAARVVRTVGADCMGVQYENLGSAESNRLQEFLLPLILATLDTSNQAGRRNSAAGLLLPPG